MPDDEQKVKAYRADITCRSVYARWRPLTLASEI
jgi:hypothetical protein